MGFRNNLIKKEGDEYKFTQFNPNIKFTPVMEEVLLTLQLLFILNYTPTLTNCVGLLCNLLDRSDRAIGSALQNIADLDLIDYHRSGQSRVIELQLDHPFFESALFRFFGFNDWLAEEQNEKEGSISKPFGFLPSEKNLHKYLAFIQKEELKVDEEIVKYKKWLEWIEKIELTIAYAEDPSLENSEEYLDNPIQLFADEVVSRIKQEESVSVNQLYLEEIKEIILDVFNDYKNTPPWIDDAFLNPRSDMLDDFLDGFHES